jgi:hypothetical protein
VSSRGRGDPVATEWRIDILAEEQTALIDRIVRTKGDFKEDDPNCDIHSTATSILKDWNSLQKCLSRDKNVSEKGNTHLLQALINSIPRSQPSLGQAIFDKLNLIRVPVQAGTSEVGTKAEEITEISYAPFDHSGPRSQRGIPDTWRPGQGVPTEPRAQRGYSDTWRPAQGNRGTYSHGSGRGAIQKQVPVIRVTRTILHFPSFRPSIRDPRLPGDSQCDCADSSVDIQIKTL